MGTKNLQKQKETITAIKYAVIRQIMHPSLCTMWFTRQSEYAILPTVNRVQQAANDLELQDSPQKVSLDSLVAGVVNYRKLVTPKL